MFRTTLTRRTSTKLTTTRQTRLIAATGSTTRNIAEALLITGRQRARSKINCSSAVAELAIVLATELALEIAPVVELLLVIAAHRRDLVRLLAAEDLAAAAAETTREPAAAEGVIAWEVAE